jgi:hypothetical protein
MIEKPLTTLKIIDIKDAFNLFDGLSNNLKLYRTANPNIHFEVNYAPDYSLQCSK